MRRGYKIDIQDVASGDSRRTQDERWPLVSYERARTLLGVHRSRNYQILHWRGISFHRGRRTVDLPPVRNGRGPLFQVAGSFGVSCFGGFFFSDADQEWQATKPIVFSTKRAIPGLSPERCQTISRSLPWLPGAELNISGTMGSKGELEGPRRETTERHSKDTRRLETTTTPALHPPCGIFFLLPWRPVTLTRCVTPLRSHHHLLQLRQRRVHYPRVARHQRRRGWRVPRPAPRCQAHQHPLSARPPARPVSPI